MFGFSSRTAGNFGFGCFAGLKQWHYHCCKRRLIRRRLPCSASDWFLHELQGPANSGEQFSCISAYLIQEKATCTDIIVWNFWTHFVLYSLCMVFELQFFKFSCRVTKLPLIICTNVVRTLLHSFPLQFVTAIQANRAARYDTVR